MGIEIKDEKELIPFIGPPLQDSFHERFGFDENQIQAAMVFFRERYSVKGIFENVLYQGVDDMLSLLKNQNRKVYLATSKPTQYASLILKHFDIYKYFDGVYGATMDEKLVKKADILNMAVKTENTDINKAVMVGDRVHDYDGSKAVGMDFIFLSIGYAGEEEAEMLTKKATYTANNMKSLCELFQKI